MAKPNDLDDVNVKLGLADPGDKPPLFRLIDGSTIKTWDKSGNALKKIKRKAILLWLATDDLPTGMTVDNYVVRLTYTDEDGDKILIANNTDLQTARREMKKHGKVKILAQVSKKSEDTPDSGAQKPEDAPAEDNRPEPSAAEAPKEQPKAAKEEPNASKKEPKAASQTSNRSSAASQMNPMMEAILGMVADTVKESRFAAEDVRDAVITAAMKDSPLRSSASARSTATASAKSASAKSTASAKSGEKEDSKPKAREMPAQSDVPAEETKDSAANADAPAEDDADVAEENEASGERPFIHGRHTCDGCLSSPILGLRYHATNLPDYDLCQTCYENYRGTEIVFETMELDRDRPLQERWHRRHAKLTRLGRPFRAGRRGRGPRRNCGNGGKSQVPPPPGPHGMPPPHHGMPPPPPPGPHGMPPPPPGPHGMPPPPPGPHGMPPPPPPGPHNMPPPPGPQGMPPPPHHGPPFHPHFGMHPHAPPHVMRDPVEYLDLALKEAMRRSREEYEKTLEEASRTASESASSAKDTSVEAASKNEKVVVETVKDGDDEVEPKEAVKDVEDVKPRATAGSMPTASLSVGNPGTEVSFEQDMAKSHAQSSVAEAEIVFEPEVEVVDKKASEAKDVSSAGSPDKASFASDAEGNGDIAAELGATFDQVAEAIDAMHSEFERAAKSTSNDEADSDVEEESENGDGQGATIVSGEHTDNNQNGTIVSAGVGSTIPSAPSMDQDEESHDSWQVVSDEHQMAHDEALAHAAQVIGSALFNSDMARSNENVDENNMEQSQGSGASCGVSTISSVPTNVSTLGAEAPSVNQALIERWSGLLEALRPMGFVNDTENLDVIEFIKASHVGVDSEEDITIEQVVNEIMRRRGW